MATATTSQSNMRVWRYNTTTGGIENHLQLHTSVPLPKPSAQDHLVQVLAVGLNPVDYKPAEAFVGRFAVKKPATPGFDFAGRIVTPASGSELHIDDLVFGLTGTNPMIGGALAEYIAVPAECVGLLSEKVSPVQAAGAPVGAITAYDSLIPYIKPGSRVFINGGSGGVGSFAIQIAKAAGAHVTVSCSSRNADFCRSLGADKVFDYNQRPLLQQLAAAEPFDHVVDCVFNDPALFFRAHTYTSPGAKFVEVGWSPDLASLRFVLAAHLLPRFLGGGRRQVVMIVADTKQETLRKVAAWLEDGTIRTAIDRVYAMGEVVDAYKRLKTSRASGKIIVDVAGEGDKRVSGSGIGHL